MAFKLNIKKLLCHVSEKVKAVDIHENHSWVLSALFSGHAHIYNYETQTTVKKFEISEDHLRAAKFIPKENWFVVAGDNKKISIYNYNTMEKLEEIEGHKDYIRCISCHPKKRLLLTGSDDSTIKLWEYDKKGKLKKKQEYLEHKHFVMCVKFNPKDPNYFASCSLDTHIKVWNIDSQSSNFTLKEHSNGVNSLDFNPKDDNILVSASDDRTLKIWDLQQRKCLFNLDNEHLDNIMAVIYHPDMPYIISASEDKTVIIWNTNTMKKQQTINYYLQQCWTLSLHPNKSKVIAIGYNEGTVVIKFEDESKASLKKGKLIFANNHDIYSSNLKAIPKGDLVDGAVLQLKKKDLGRSDIYPLSLKHSPNGQLFSICDNKEFIIYKAQSFKNLRFGTGSHFVWGKDNSYAVIENEGVSIYDSNFAIITKIETDYPVENLYGGNLLGIQSTDMILFYTWDTSIMIQKVGILPKNLYWNPVHNQLAITTKESLFILEYNKEMVESELKRLEEEEEVLEDGIDGAFTVLSEINEVVFSAIWISKSLFFINKVGKLNYISGEKVFNYSYLQNAHEILGLVNNQKRLYLLTSKNEVISYELPIAFGEAIACITDGQFNKLDSYMKKLNDAQIDKIAKFLEKMGFIENAFRIAKNNTMKFNYAIQLEEIEKACEIAEKSGSMERWKIIGDLTMKKGDFDQAESCFKKANDYPSLFLLYSSLGYKEGIEWLAKTTLENKIFSIAFNSYFILRNIPKCLECLIGSKKYPEAAFFAKSYYPSQISRIVVMWRESLKKSNPMISQMIADPTEYDDDEQFDDLFFTDKMEKILGPKMMVDVPAHKFEEFEKKLSTDLFRIAKDKGIEKLNDFSYYASEQEEENHNDDEAEEEETED